MKICIVKYCTRASQSLQAETELSAVQMRTLGALVLKWLKQNTGNWNKKPKPLWCCVQRKNNVKPWPGSFRRCSTRCASLGPALLCASTRIHDTAVGLPQNPFCPFGRSLFKIWLFSFIFFCGLHVFEKVFLFQFGLNSSLCKRSLKKFDYLRNECSELGLKLYFLVVL